MCVCLNVKTKRTLLRCFTSLGSIRTCHPVQYCTLDFFLAHYVILFTTICLSYKHIQSFFYNTFYVNLYQTKKGTLPYFKHRKGSFYSRNKNIIFVCAHSDFLISHWHKLRHFLWGIVITPWNNGNIIWDIIILFEIGRNLNYFKNLKYK